MVARTHYPELLAPAGSLEKLRIATLYGADAVYLSGQNFGLRQAADNFSLEELEEGIDFAHRHGTKTYLTLNSFFHNRDFKGMESFLQFLKFHKADALIISDLGALSLAKKVGLPVHLSTQASCLNSESGKFWHRAGVERLILGREVSIAEAGAIKKSTGLEVELFIHGSMCMSYSGHCVISNFTSGRDSNRGGCAHSCRFEYNLKVEEEIGSREPDSQCSSQSNAGEQFQGRSYFMSSKDLNGIDLLPQFIEHKIDSLKIEGRNKGPLYAATVTKVYRYAIDQMAKNGKLSIEELTVLQSELGKMSHRDYTPASLVQKASEDSIYDKRESEDNRYPFAGTVLAIMENKSVLLEVKTAIEDGDVLEVLQEGGNFLTLNLREIYNILGERIKRSRPSSVIRLPFVDGLKIGQLVRKVNQSEANLGSLYGERTNMGLDAPFKGESVI